MSTIHECTLMHYKDGSDYVICSINKLDGTLNMKTSPRWCPMKPQHTQNDE